MINVSLFADDTKCFWIIESPTDALVLKTETTNVEKWAQSWKLEFNARKCNVLSITRKRQPLVAEYSINGETTKTRFLPERPRRDVAVILLHITSIKLGHCVT